MLQTEAGTTHASEKFPNPSDKLPDVFEQIRRANVYRVRGDKRQMYDQYGERMTVYQNILKSFQELLSAAGTANSFPDMTEFQHDLQDILSANLWAEEPETMKELLDSSLEDNLRSLLGAMVRMLNTLVEKRRIGLADWPSTESCTLTFYQGQTTKRATDVREYSNRTETDVDTLLVTSVHRHDLIDAKVHELPAEKIRKPHRVQRFLRAIRPWLVPYLRVIDGTIVRKQTSTTTTVLRTEVRTDFKPDPVIAIGDYVLVGWCPEEAAKDEKKDKEEERLRMKRKQEESDKEGLMTFAWSCIGVSSLLGVLSMCFGSGITFLIAIPVGLLGGVLIWSQAK